MPSAEIEEPARQKSLRLWPGVALVVLQWLVRFGLPLVLPDRVALAVLSTVGIGVAIFLWWIFFSRAVWWERGLGLLLTVAAFAATKPLLDPSLATAGQGFFFYIYAIPVVSSALVVWAVATRNLPDRPRRVTLAATILLAVGAFALVRISGITTTAETDFSWRWAQTAEERLLAETGSGTSPLLPSGAVGAVGAPDREWPGFRGPDRDSILHGVHIAADWGESPPVELWRRPVGPGWSSFAVHGDLLYTLEQRGEDEIVACYRVGTGEPVWLHRDKARFWEATGGPGPRSTPTLDEGRVLTFGATGILNALDAADGSVLWSRDVAADTGAEVPTWGFSSSPLVVDDLVLVAAAGRLVAYGRETGELRWSGPDGGPSYSSPQLLTIGGVTQILLLSEAGVRSVVPADGTLLWEHPWPGYPIVQPALTGDGDVLVTANAESGIRRLAVAHGPEGWSVEERWTSSGLKPFFNDFVVHKGHAFGFDGRILACVDLATGERKWKGGRYGNGQLLLLADQDLLLVLTEQGELALVRATPDAFTELARVPAITGKTWNHPVLLGDLLLVRNGEEMVAFRVPLAKS